MKKIFYLNYRIDKEMPLFSLCGFFYRVFSRFYPCCILLRLNKIGSADMGMLYWRGSVSLQHISRISALTTPSTVNCMTTYKG